MHNKEQMNPEWAAIRGTDIDDYLKTVNGQVWSTTIKFKRSPTLDTPYIKSLLALQLLGLGTWQDICGMAKEGTGHPCWGADRKRSLLGGKFIEVVKVQGSRKKYFQLTERGEKTIDWAISH